MSTTLEIPDYDIPMIPAGSRVDVALSISVDDWPAGRITKTGTVNAVEMRLKIKMPEYKIIGLNYIYDITLDNGKRLHHVDSTWVSLCDDDESDE